MFVEALYNPTCGVVEYDDSVPIKEDLALVKYVFLIRGPSNVSRSLTCDRCLSVCLCYVEGLKDNELDQSCVHVSVVKSPTFMPPKLQFSTYSQTTVIYSFIQAILIILLN